jgi:hypothetical protein
LLCLPPRGSPDREAPPPDRGAPPSNRGAPPSQGCRRGWGAAAAVEDGEQRRPWRPVRCAALLLAPAPALLSSHADLRWRHGRAGAGRGHGAAARRGEGGSWPWQSATGERECEREGGSWFAAPPGCATGEADCILQLVLHHLLEREQ